jgi:hypothetical protein
VTSAVTSIYQANKTAEGYAKRSQRDFQFGVGDTVLLSTKYFIHEASKIKTEVSSQVRWSLQDI